MTAVREATAPVDGPRYALRLYITGLTPHSTRAVVAVRRLCEERLAGRCDLEVIDLHQEPDGAREDGVTVAPTLVKRGPGPVTRIGGDLSDAARVLAGLGITEAVP